MAGWAYDSATPYDSAAAYDGEGTGGVVTTRGVMRLGSRSAPRMAIAPTTAEASRMVRADRTSSRMRRGQP